jgi:hypothetical protein
MFNPVHEKDFTALPGQGIGGLRDPVPQLFCYQVVLFNIFVIVPQAFKHQDAPVKLLVVAEVVEAAVPHGGGQVRSRRTVFFNLTPLLPQADKGFLHDLFGRVVILHVFEGKKGQPFEMPAKKRFKFSPSESLAAGMSNAVQEKMNLVQDNAK